MGESNGEWGTLAQHDDALTEAWDECSRLPESGVNPALDALCQRKNITIEALMRLGARLASDTVLAFAAGGGVKYRDLTTDRRWSFPGSTWDQLKVVRGTDTAAEAVIVCEGETDGARLTMLYPDCDVAVMPAGAKYFPAEYAEQIAGYERVLVGLDNDSAGDQGAAKVAERLPQAERFTPPAGDWCEVDKAPPIPEPPEQPPSIIVFGGDLMNLEVPEVASWFENALLPIGGLMLIHGWLKSFKTFLSFDLMNAIAQGQDWMGFEPTEEPARTCIMQFELPWPYYRERTQRLRDNAREPALWDRHFGTYSPTIRPLFTAGNTAHEDAILRELVNADVSVLLVDPIRRALGTADMNAENEVRRTLAFFERCNNEGITVIATHHDNKEGGRSRGGDPLNMTGSGAFGGDADSIVSIALPPGDERNTSLRRNVFFTLRNGPPVKPRGFEIINGLVLPSPEPHGEWEADEDDGTPAI